MKDSKTLAASMLGSTLLLLLLAGLSQNTFAAADDVDLSFDSGSGVNGPVNALVVQPDGKVILGGSFTMVKGLVRRGIARLNADGSGDPGFAPGAPFTSPATIYALALQSDGKVIFGQDSAANYGITRLNDDGSYDTNFNSNAYAAIASTSPFDPFRVTALLVQPDGKVLYAGETLLRLNPDGTRDTNFISGAIGYVYSMARQTDGKLIVGGYFYADYVGGSPIGYRLARLNTDGSLDNTFDQAAGQGGLFYSIVLQPDGKVLAGGRFIGTNSACLMRFTGDGTVDSTFAEVTGSGPGGKPETRAIGLQPDGRVLVGGVFTPINGSPRTNLVRLNTNGTVDLSFTNDAVGAFDASVQAIAIQADGAALIGGSFTTLNGAGRSRVARLTAAGSVDAGFQPGRAAVDSPITRLSLLPDGKTLAGGLVTFQNGSNQYATVRLNTDGSRDDTFSSAGFTPDVGLRNSSDDYNLWTCLEVQSDGKVLVGGGFSHFNGAARNRMARLNSNGSLDLSSNPAADAAVSAIHLQPDGRILIGGDFLTVNGVLRPYVARLYGDSVTPSLNIAHSNSDLVFSWPAAFGNFQLQETTNLGAVAWSTVAAPGSTNNSVISVSLSATGSGRFFRLVSP